MFSRPCSRNTLFLSPEAFFLLAASIFGVTFVLLLAPLFGADEQRHFYRAYWMAEGHLLASKQEDTAGAELPKSLSGLLDNTSNSRAFLHPIGWDGLRDALHARSELLAVPLAPSERTWTSMGNSPNFGPVSYLPQALAIATIRWLEPAPVILMYAGRFGNLLAFMAVVFLAIRITPVFKWVFTAIALLPMTLLQAGSLSADAPTTALAFLLIALILRAVFEVEPALSSRDILCILTVSLLLVFAKPGYFLLSGLVLLIPYRKLGTAKRAIAWAALYAMTQIASVAAMAKIVALVFVQPAGCSRDLQLQYLHAKPLQFAHAILQGAVDLVRFRPNVFERLLGHLQHNPFVQVVPQLAFICLPWLVVLALIDFRENASWSFPKRAFILMTAVGGLLQILFMLYLYWTPVNLPTVVGLHGRVLIPLLPVFLLPLLNKVSFLRVAPKITAGVTILVSSVALLAGVFMLLDAFYLPKTSLVPEGMFSKTGASIATHWRVSTANPAMELAFVTPGDSNAGLQQTWYAPDDGNPYVRMQRFSVDLDVQPFTHYTLHVNATSQTDASIGVTVVSVDPGEAGAQVFKYITYFSKFGVTLRPNSAGQFRFGDFQTGNVHTIRVYSFCEGTSFPASVIWHEWAITKHTF